MTALIWQVVRHLALCGAIATFSLRIGDIRGAAVGALVALALCVAAALVVVLNWRRGSPIVRVVPLTIVAAVWFCFLTFGLSWLSWFEWFMGRGWFVALFVLAFVITPLFLRAIDRTRGFVRGER